MRWSVDWEILNVLQGVPTSLASFYELNFSTKMNLLIANINTDLVFERFCAEFRIFKRLHVGPGA